MSSTESLIDTLSLSNSHSLYVLLYFSSSSYLSIYIYKSFRLVNCLFSLLYIIFFLNLYLLHFVSFRNFVAFVSIASFVSFEG